MNNCGKRFHGEAAKFRFLNELIKLLTPKVSDGGPDCSFPSVPILFSRFGSSG